MCATILERQTWTLSMLYPSILHFRDVIARRERTMRLWKYAQVLDTEDRPHELNDVHP
jgi:hypothetical protein